MTDITLIKDIYAKPESYAGKCVKLGGWVRTLRDQKQFGFIMLHDGSCFTPLQLVFTRDELENAYDPIAKLGTGVAIEVTGEVVLTPENNQPCELKVKEVVCVGDCPAHYPLQPKRHSVEFLRSIAHLRPRTNLFQAVFRVRSEAAYAIHEFFHEQGFVYVHTPLITASDAEGAGAMFRVTTMDMENVPKTEDGGVDYSQDFFGKPSYLTVSGQLAGETYALAFRNIYTFGPTFRAENSNTPRHAAEFWHIEPEIAFADLDDDIRLAEAMLKHVIAKVLERCPEELNFLNKFIDKGLKERLTSVLESDFARVTYTQAIELLAKADVKFDYKPEWGADIQTEHERYLAEQIYKRPVFVTDYPKDIKAFYMKQNDDGKTVAATDLLVPGVGELIGGSQREEDYDKLVQRIEELGLAREDYSWYLELREFGSVKHAGFGLGFERLIMYLTGINNIRDAIPYPRTPGNAEY